MKEHVAIRNFGPIQQAEIDVGSLTIFVGPQATGKSLAAQVLYFLRGMEDLLSPDISGQARLPLEDILSALDWWFGASHNIYVEPTTKLIWKAIGNDSPEELRWDEGGAHLNDTLHNRIQKWQKQPYASKAQVYIPAGRTLYSFLPPSSAIRILSRTQQQWPGHILTFYETLGTAIESLWREQQQQDRGLFTMWYDETKFMRQRINSITKGQLRYGPQTISLEVGQRLLNPTTFSAGQMEIWPFWTIVEAYLIPGIFAFKHLYFEEPEAHLHPGAQRSVMEIVAYLVRQGVQVLLTTHSPYILYAVNNFLMAQKVLDAGQELPPDVPTETTLRSEQVAAYRFAPGGNVHDIMDVETGLIDGAELDQVADDLGATFTDLQERLEGVA